MTRQPRWLAEERISERLPATIAALRDVAGAADYYNLTVSQLHTYAVGAGQYVVHNCPDPGAGGGG